MVTSIGITFPYSWQYGPEEIDIFNSTVRQVDDYFSNHRNLVINTTWFGPQFDNQEWAKVVALINQGKEFDNLFLLAVIDPMYLESHDLDLIMDQLKIKQLYKIGMYADSKYEWNFHSIAVAQLCPKYTNDQLLMTDPEYVFMLYQRKPRLHRLELTNILLAQNYKKHGIVTLGSSDSDNRVWGDNINAPLLTINDSPSDYKHNGSCSDFGGIPNDLVSLGRLDLWQKHFLNIVSETEFDEWKPRFITEKTWKPIIGLRPFVVHGQRSIYSWLRNQGFRTFNHYWSHVPVETDDNQHSNVIGVIDFLRNKTSDELKDMYQDMLPDLLYNRNRYFEFAVEQKYKINHLFE